MVAFPIAGQAGVRAGATSVVATFTVVDPRRSGFLTVFPCGRAMPVASSLNYLAGEVVPNTITASLGTGGAVCVYPQHDLDLVVDVAASIGPGGHGFAGVAPTRLLDTRSGLGGRRLPAGGQIAVAVSGRGGVPAGAVAAAVNVTATEASRAGYVTAWPCDQPRPLASVVNIVPGVSRADNAVVRLSARGEVCLYSQSPTELIVDVSGYYGAGAGGAHQAVVPMRRLDTAQRPGWPRATRWRPDPHAAHRRARRHPDDSPRHPGEPRGRRPGGPDVRHGLPVQPVSPRRSRTSTSSRPAPSGPTGPRCRSTPTGGCACSPWRPPTWWSTSRAG